MAEVEVLEQKPLGRIRVGIEDNRAEVEFAGAGGDVVCRYGRKQKTGKKNQGAPGQRNPHKSSLTRR